jgi:glycosyltransferase involved in cell wall biosynthesis
MSKQRILVIAHAHPDFSLGGGELAAYNLYKAYRNNPEVEDAWFLARADRGRGPAGNITVRRPNEYLWEQAVHDWHLMKAVNQESLTTWFADLVRALKPTVVHMHHYAHLGLECIRIIKQVDPTIRIALTLHEYMAICTHNGQMIKPGSLTLCSRASFDECHQCYPHRTAEDFWLRKHQFERHFDMVDQFIAPSDFLRRRYVDWGVPAEKIVVIENGQANSVALPPRELRSGEKRSRFAFFGQVNPYKGLDVLLNAMTHMERLDRRRFVLEVHGANLEQQPAEFRQKIETLRVPLIQAGVVQWVGPYQPHELSSRMAAVDWVVIPSVWWENSPMVIQEAFVHGRPVVCSDIGGMAEKVRHRIDGYHVAAGNVLQWAQALTNLSKYTEEWDSLRAGIMRPITYAECGAAHLELLASRRPETAAPPQLEPQLQQPIKPIRRATIPVRYAA